MSYQQQQQQQQQRHLLIERITNRIPSNLSIGQHRTNHLHTVLQNVHLLLVHGQVTIIFVVSVGLSVCLPVCLFVCAEFFSAVFDPISIKLGHMLYVWV